LFPYALSDWLLVDDERLEGSVIPGEEEHSGTMIRGSMEGQMTVATSGTFDLLSLSFTPLPLLSPSHLRCPSNRVDLLLNRDTGCIAPPEVRYARGMGESKSWQKDGSSFTSNLI
jgi:hypothetical protein